MEVILLDQTPARRTKTLVVDSTTDPQIKVLRSAILSIITKSPNASRLDDRGLGVPSDWQTRNRFIVRHGHKMLFQMDVEQLREFYNKLQAMRNTGWAYRQPIA